MSKRLTTNVRRPAAIEILVDGVPVTAYEGESLATVLLAAGRSAFSRDPSGRLRSPYCNMGVCFDCMIVVELEARTAACARALLRLSLECRCLSPKSASLRLERSRL